MISVAGSGAVFGTAAAGVSFTVTPTAPVFMLFVPARDVVSEGALITVEGSLVDCSVTGTTEVDTITLSEDIQPQQEY